MSKRCDCKIFEWFVNATCIVQAAISASAIILPPAYFSGIGGVGTGICGYSVVVTHGVNAVVFLLDVYLGQQRFPKHRVIWAIGFMCSYFIFSYVYTGVNGGAPLYGFLDWNNGFPVALIGSIWLGVVLPIIVYGVLAKMTEEKKDRAQKDDGKDIQDLEVQV